MIRFRDFEGGCVLCMLVFDEMMRRLNRIRDPNVTVMESHRRERDGCTG